jgi:hypothetical protein
MRKPLKIQSRFKNQKPKGRIYAGERLASCAIIRDGVIHNGQRSHAQIRAALGDTDAYEQKYRPDDHEGFMTSTGRFVTRDEAKPIGEAAGQCQPTVRELLSSDIRW